jgi:hypothetical protein
MNASKNFAALPGFLPGCIASAIICVSTASREKKETQTMDPRLKQYEARQSDHVTNC